MGEFAKKSRARLLAVQALYQAEQTGLEANKIIEQFKLDGAETDDGVIHMDDVDVALFTNIITGTIENHEDLNQKITATLSKDWRLDRLDATARATLRAGCYELSTGHIAHQIVIDDYVDVAKSFLDTPDVSFINAALDRMANPQATEGAN